MNAPSTPDALTAERERLAQIRTFLRDYVVPTPLLSSRTLSEMTGAEIWLKAEILQRTGSYKPRGLTWRVSRLTPEERERGVVTVSAGNAGQGMAYATGTHGVRCTVILPKGASKAKADASRGYGAEVIYAENSPEAFAMAERMAAETGIVFINPTDDPIVMDGHAGVALEILDDLPDVDVIIVPVGGGGLIGGIAQGIAAHGGRVEVIGVEPTGANAMSQSLKLGRPIKLPGAASVADGLAAPFAGQHPFPIVRDLTAGIVEVEDAEIVAAMKLIMQRCKLFVEPSGAAGLAGAFKIRDRLAGRRVAIVLSGGNVDFDRLAAIVTD